MVSACPSTRLLRGQHMVCTKCRQDRPASSEFFPEDRRYRTGFGSWCFGCLRQKQRDSSRVWRRRFPEKQWANNLKQYGITPSGYMDLFRQQGGMCAICSVPPKAHRRLVVDHDHRTGRVRGLLCDRCNGAILSLADKDDHFMPKLALYLLTPESRRALDAVARGERCL